MVFNFLDSILDRKQFALAADASIGIGLAGAAGAAVTGMTDWSDVDPPARCLGLVHGLLNLNGTALFATSLVLRSKKCRKSGRIVSALGYAVMSYAAHLGGKLVYEHRVGVDRTDGQVFPENFVTVLPESQLAEDKPTRAMVQDAPILLVRRAGRLFAMADTCSHFRGPLSDGTLVDNCIVCRITLPRLTWKMAMSMRRGAIGARLCESSCEVPRRSRQWMEFADRRCE